jgi:hypothetical protein
LAAQISLLFFTGWRLFVHVVICLPSFCLLLDRVLAVTSLLRHIVLKGAIFRFWAPVFYLDCFFEFLCRRSRPHEGEPV